MDSYEQQVEHIARAFYDAQDDAGAWESEPDILKQEFRHFAREAMTLYAQKQLQDVLNSTTPGLPEAA